MEYEKIIIELLNRIVTLEEKVTKLEKREANEHNNPSELASGSKKYRFLTDFLLKSDQPRIQLSFSELEHILNFKLPDSASTHRTFWANTTSHSIALSWLSADYLVREVDLENQYIVFETKRGYELIRTGKSTAMTEEKHLLTCKNHNMINLYQKLRKTLFDHFENVATGATSYYIHWDVTGVRKRQFANIYIQKSKIRIETLVPIKEVDIGEHVPDTHGYTLNYRTDIFSDADIERVKGIILDSYNQIKNLV